MAGCTSLSAELPTHHSNQSCQLTGAVASTGSGSLLPSSDHHPPSPPYVLVPLASIHQPPLLPGPIEHNPGLHVTHRFGAPPLWSLPSCSCCCSWRFCRSFCAMSLRCVKSASKKVKSSPATPGEGGSGKEGGKCTAWSLMF